MWESTNFINGIQYSDGVGECISYNRTGPPTPHPTLSKTEKTQTIRKDFKIYLRKMFFFFLFCTYAKQLLLCCVMCVCCLALTPLALLTSHFAHTRRLSFSESVCLHTRVSLTTTHRITLVKLSCALNSRPFFFKKNRLLFYWKKF